MSFDIDRSIGVISWFAMAIAIMTLAPARAEVSDAQLAGMGDLTETLRIEGELAACFERRDRKCLKALGEGIRKKDGAVLSELQALMQKQPRVDPAKRILEQMEAGNPMTFGPELDPTIKKLGPCHYAWMAIRRIALEAADRRLKVVRREIPAGREKDRVWMIDGTEVDDLYAEYTIRCERIRALPKSERKVGTACAVHGGCYPGNDPDKK